MPLHRHVAERIAARDGAGAQQAVLQLIDNAELDVRRGVENRNKRRNGQGAKP